MNVIKLKKIRIILKNIKKTEKLDFNRHSMFKSMDNSGTTTLDNS